MLKTWLVATCFFLGVLLAQAPAAHAQQLQSVRDCAVGRRVVTNGGRKGTITRVDTAWSYCYVKFDDTGKEEELLYSLLNLAGGTTANLAGRGQEFQSFRDCTVGRRVATNGGRKGTITRLNTAWSYCYVKFDDTGKEEQMLYSLLYAEGGTTGAAGVAVGVYECITGEVTTMILRITSPGSYSVQGRPGKFQMSPNGTIVFESGPLAGQFHSKLLSDGRVGMNTDGGAFYGTSCELNRTMK
jgi:preprotein translocase subunit YajC